jgi:hypothetical protein
VCRASRVGAKEWLRTLRRLVVSGGFVTGGEGDTNAVWRLDLGSFGGSSWLTLDANGPSTRAVR